MSIIRNPAVYFFVILIFISCFAMPSSAEEGVSELPPVLRKILDSAAKRDLFEGSKTYLPTAVTLALDAEPERNERILDYVADNFPDRATDILAVLTTSHPDISETFRVRADIGPPTASEVEEAMAPAPPQSQYMGFFARNGISGSVELGGGMTSGNTDETAVTSAIKGVVDRKIWRHKLDLVLDWTRTQGETTKQRLFAGYELNHKISERSFLFGQITYTDDRFSGFDYRLFESAGIGRDFIVTDRFDLDTKLGVAAREDKVLTTGKTEVEIGGQLESNFVWHLSDTSSLVNEASFYASGMRTLVEDTVALELQINSRLLGKASFNYLRDSNVPEGSEKVDTITRFTLLYRFGHAEKK